MLLEKIENNERGHSGLNFVVIMFMLMCLICAFMDLMDMARIKSMTSSQANLLGFHACIQSGFKSNVPADWIQFYGDNGKYLTSVKAIDNLNKLSKKTRAISTKATLGGTNLSSSPVINWRDESVLTVESKFQLKYLTAFGLMNDVYTHTSSYDVIGYWVHKTTIL